MGCLHVDSWFAHLSPITNFYQPMVCARYTNSTIECPVGQLAVLWRHGGTGRYLCGFFTIDPITNAGEPTAWKILARTSAPSKSVISTAADLEGIGELTSLEINYLVERYVAWLMINLTETEHISLTDGNAHEAATKMIGDVCTQIYQRADQSIIKAHPELASCAVAGNCIEPALTTTHEATTHEASTALSEQPDHMQRLMHQNLILQQRIDSLEAAGTSATALPLTSHPSNQHSLTPTTESIDLFTPLHQRKATPYNFVSAPLAVHHVTDLCAALWQQ